ncbi:uncharacterized protein METZ01_LOCUS148759 [marine metagenome]|uniref:Uncharacterized protein n=1 Tax=marine metagenome TaxID=408172 RepID=A0A382A2Y8_9ZZZZ
MIRLIATLMLVFVFNAQVGAEENRHNVLIVLM